MDWTDLGIRNVTEEYGSSDVHLATLEQHPGRQSARVTKCVGIVVVGVGRYKSECWFLVSARELEGLVEPTPRCREEGAIKLGDGVEQHHITVDKVAHRQSSRNSLAEGVPKTNTMVIVPRTIISPCRVLVRKVIPPSIFVVSSAGQ